MTQKETTELEHELAAALGKVDEQRELLRLSQEENEEKRRDIVYLATEKAKLENRIKRLEEALDTLTLVVGLTPISGNKDALQEAIALARSEIKAKEAKL